LACLAAEVSDAKLARDVRVWDVRSFSSLADYYVVATVDSVPQMEAIEETLEYRMKTEENAAPPRRDGRGTAPWRVLDCGGVLLHLFTEQARSFYGLERLWEGAKPVVWAKKPAAPRSRRRRSPSAAE
jgi:ribosome-associated protein